VSIILTSRVPRSSMDSCVIPQYLLSRCTYIHKYLVSSHISSETRLWCVLQVGRDCKADWSSSPFNMSDLESDADSLAVELGDPWDETLDESRLVVSFVWTKTPCFMLQLQSCRSIHVHLAF
jgi:hypothetical protein